MRRWLIKQIRDSVGDTTFAAVSFAVGLVILGYALWEDWDLVAAFRFNLDLIALLKYIPIVGKKMGRGWVLIGFDKTLFFIELWALVALILRVVGLALGVFWRWLCGRFRFAGWLHRRSRTRRYR